MLFYVGLCVLIVIASVIFCYLINFKDPGGASGIMAHYVYITIGSVLITLAVWLMRR